MPPDDMRVFFFRQMNTFEHQIVQPFLGNMRRIHGLEHSTYTRNAIVQKTTWDHRTNFKPSRDRAPAMA